MSTQLGFIINHKRLKIIEYLSVISRQNISTVSMITNNEIWQIQTTFSKIERTKSTEIVKRGLIMGFTIDLQVSQ